MSNQISAVRCEQSHCAGRGQDSQYYCVKCDMELCSVCIFEHRKNTSISGLSCDDEICHGSRNQNSFDPKPEPQEISIAFTKSDDGKTCSYCGSDLIIKETKGDVARKIRTCPLPISECRPIKKFDLNAFIEKNREEVTNTDDSDVYKIESRGLELKHAKKIIELNQDRKITAPNEQVTEIKIIMDTSFSGITLKKEGKTFSFVTCSEGWENEGINRVSDNYKLVKIQKIGKLSRKCGCIYHNSQLCKIQGDLRDKYRNDDNYNLDNMEKQEEEKFYDKIDFIKVTLQRINFTVDTELAKYFFDKRFVKLKRNPETADDFALKFIHREDRNGKRWIIGRCKALAKTEDIEVQVRGHEFHPARHDRTSGDFVGEDTDTLNWYRARDDYAVYLTRDEFSDYRHKQSTSLDRYVIQPTPTFAGILKEPEQREKEKEEYHQCFVRFASQFEVKSTEVRITNWDGQILIASGFAYLTRSGAYQIRKRSDKN